ncbi:MAG: VWA domain-containing protein [Verrucomicrobia bacterium]|nr:VWA domain-containing protein [Verrucomicrobiota bacterium]
MNSTRIPSATPNPPPTAAGWWTWLALGTAAVLLLPGCRMCPGRISHAPGSQPGSASAPPGSLPSPDEELWVIARGDAGAPADDDGGPGSGALIAHPVAWDQEVPLPLKHTEMRASISAHIATVSVIQQFSNPYEGKIEAVYVFPLPHHAAVNEFLMVIGERRIRGLIRERAQAEAIYCEAKRQGYVASLLTQERPNLFTQAVANIEPGKELEVRLTYFHTLAYEEGWYEFVFPMVVGPRFNPPGWTNSVAPAPRAVAARSAGRPTQVACLNPHERTGHDIALEVELEAGVNVEELVCRSHVITQRVAAPGRWSIALSPNDRIPNRDFVLRYRVAGDQLKSSLLTHRDERGGFFTLMLYPPRELVRLDRQPLEVVFVLDCSGSMRGRPLDQAKLAIERGLRQLRPDDTFQLIRFSNDASAFGPEPVPASPEHIRRALHYLAALKSEGGTMMLQGIEAALTFPHDWARLRFVCFLTDGYIGNEAQILAAIEQHLGASRIFSFGIGSSVNRYLIEHMAKVGRGAVAYLGPHDSAAHVMDTFMARIQHPTMTDLKLDWNGWRVTDVYPQRLPDLFVGRPVILTGRFEGAPDAEIRITGHAGAQPVQVSLHAPAVQSAAAHPALPHVWARMKIADLYDQWAFRPDPGVAEAIRKVALEYGLMSAYTAFVAVDASRRTVGREGTTVPVAVPVPDGVRYETTVGSP